MQKYSQDGKDGIKVIQKEKAKAAAQLVVKKFHNLEGAEIENYMKENFEPAWKEHDVKSQNFIDITEAYQLLNNL